MVIVKYAIKEAMRCSVLVDVFH